VTLIHSAQLPKLCTRMNVFPQVTDLQTLCYKRLRRRAGHEYGLAHHYFQASFSTRQLEKLRLKLCGR
jgi:hypothetical protein